MAHFTAKFDAFIELGRKRVLEERNQFRLDVAELQGTTPPYICPRSPSQSARLTNKIKQRTSA